jgi:hypothetical protein
MQFNKYSNNHFWYAASTISDNFDYMFQPEKKDFDLIFFQHSFSIFLFTFSELAFCVNCLFEDLPKLNVGLLDCVAHAFLTSLDNVHFLPTYERQKNKNGVRFSVETRINLIKQNWTESSIVFN